MSKIATHFVKLTVTQHFCVENYRVTLMTSKPVYSVFDLPPDKQAVAGQRFWLNVEKTSGCWLWRGSGPMRDRFRMGGLRIRPHRMAYELSRGRVPEGMVVDHVVCHNTSCVHPDHLGAVSPQSNNHRPPKPVEDDISEASEKPKGVLDAAFERIESELKKLRETVGGMDG